MKKLFFIPLLLFISSLSWAQGNTITRTGAGAPTGSCSFIQFYINSSNGDFYDCFAGTWNLVAGGGSGSAWSDLTSGTNNSLAAVLGTGSSLSLTGTAFVAFGANPADAGPIRLSNNTFISWEASTPGTDLTFGVNSSDILISSVQFSAPTLVSTVSTGTAPFTVTSTTVVPNLNVSQLLGGTWAIPGTIGSTTRNTALFTTVGANGQITSTLANGTAPFVVASSTVVANLNVSQLLGATWAAPGTIGSGTPSTGVFSTLRANTNLGVGSNSVVNSTPLYVAETYSGETGLIYADARITGLASDDQLTNAFFYTKLMGTQDVDVVVGASARVDLGAAANATWIRAFESVPNTNASTGVPTSAAGFYAKAGGVATTVYQFYAEAPSGSEWAFYGADNSKSSLYTFTARGAVTLTSLAGGGTDVVCASGAGLLSKGGCGGSISGLTAGTIPKAASASALTDSCLTDDGTTVTNNCPGGLVNVGDGVHAGLSSLQGNTILPSLPTNSVSEIGPSSATFVAWGFQWPNAEPSASSVALFGAASSHVSQVTFLAASSLALSATNITIAGTANQITSSAGSQSLAANRTWTLSLPDAVSLGTDNSSAGTLQLANSAAAFHTIWGSGATANNTIKGFATVPTTGQLLDCTVTSTTCLLHDSGIVTANVTTQTSNGAANQVCTYTGANKVCVPGTVTGAMMTSATVGPTQLFAQYSKGSCTEAWGGSGTSFALTSGDDAVANNNCYNDSGVTRTITAVKCRASGASNTTTVNPTFGAAGTGTTILSGALTCGDSYAYSSSGTVSNASWTTGTGIRPAMAGTLTGTSIAMIVEYTF